MLFNSYIFVLGFLPITLILYYLSAKKLGSEAARWVLVLASLFFYSWWDVKNLSLLLGSILMGHCIVFNQKKLYSAYQEANTAFLVG